jgi:hypothetical protein
MPCADTVILAALAALSTSACSDMDNPTGAEKTIIMEIGGNGKSADVTYQIGTNQSQDNGAKLPWKKETSSKDSVIITVLTAQAKDGKEITCKVTVDGKVVSENKSSGEFAIVTCSNG